MSLTAPHHQSARLIKGHTNSLTTSDQTIRDPNPITRAAAHASCSDSEHQTRRGFPPAFRWSLLTYELFFWLNCGEECRSCGSCVSSVRVLCALRADCCGLTELLDGSNEAACGAERRRAAGGGVSFGCPPSPLHVADMGINESTALG